ncbi:MAG: hypothetical protein JRN68_00680 [Nitrososphaerota archaeon]|jgi:cytochrome c biogenesis protein CcdA|nr:hypothetical protein [Nitrososphaerota archaeon]
MVSPIVLVVLDVVAMSVIVAQAIFSSQMITLMKSGMLERSWWYLSTGSIILAIGIATFIIDSLYLGAGTPLLFSQYLGTILIIAGSALSLLGILSQYNFWSSG